MRLFLDTNLFVAVLTDESAHATDSRRVLNSEHDLFTSVLNLMELRTVLTKKKLFERVAVEEAQQRIVNRTTVTVPDAQDVLAGSKRQDETMLFRWMR
ncbi:type II toxin-antitoxin system VapC family toxin [Natronomonas sp. EA1]|uniref:type II toxin-antitoxin system VapC family toxin n=1 Tax=Natronomonas sp. EA1 TaxID=3421655 RepID=UPI003EBEDE3A